MAVGLKRAHTECLGQSQGLPVVRFSRSDIGRSGVSLDDTKLAQGERLVPTFLALPGQVQGLVGVLPGLRIVSHQTTDLAEAGDSVGLTEQPARAQTFAAPLLQKHASLREALLKRIAIAQVRTMTGN